MKFVFPRRKETDAASEVKTNLLALTRILQINYYNHYDNSIFLHIFAKNKGMVVKMTGDLLELYKTGSNKRYKDVARNPVLLKGYIMAIETMLAVSNINELSKFSRLHYEKLKHEYSGFSSVRLSNSFVHRLIFTENEEGIEVKLIEIDDTHYGNKR